MARMKVRKAELSDIPALVALGAKAFLEMPFHMFADYNGQSVATTIETIINQGIGYVAVDGATVKGWIGGLISSMWFNHSHKTVSVLTMYMEKGSGITGTKLIYALTEEAKDRGFKEVSFSSICGVRGDLLDKLYERMGMIRYESNWLYRLKGA